MMVVSVGNFDPKVLFDLTMLSAIRRPCARAVISIILLKVHKLQSYTLSMTTMYNLLHKYFVRFEISNY